MKINANEKHKTWGRSRSNRLPNYDYSKDRPVHVTVCTDNKENIFDLQTHARIVIDELLRAAKDVRFRMLCYCLMPDHLHVIVSPGESSLTVSKFLNIFKGRTTAVFREKKDLKKIWQRSAFDHVIRTEENLKGVIEYIRNNPVRKGIVENADDYPYSKSFDAEIKRYL
ncbi:MAG TPA: transposase [Thermodesulfobacteriota bacterium]|nr:transposase [Thermodesulfobacteriota bacterium]